MIFRRRSLLVIVSLMVLAAAPVFGQLERKSTLDLDRVLAAGQAHLPTAELQEKLVLGMARFKELQKARKNWTKEPIFTRDQTLNLVLNSGKLYSRAINIFQGRMSEAARVSQNKYGTSAGRIIRVAFAQDSCDSCLSEALAVAEIAAELCEQEGNAPDQCSFVFAYSVSFYGATHCSPCSWVVAAGGAVS